MKLENIIYELIESKREGEYWDFKEEHHQNKADLLHDILCFSNSLHDGIRYIIIGVVDGTYEISGCCNLSTRRKQSDLIDFLRSKKFAGGYRPVSYTHLDVYKRQIMFFKYIFMSSYFAGKLMVT